MATDTELIKLPLSLGLKINGILKEKIGFVPRENKMGMMSFEFTREELELIDKLSFNAIIHLIYEHKDPLEKEADSQNFLEMNLEKIIKIL